jgi:L-ribulokinase
LLEEKSKKRGENGLIALDWWNGNRSILADMELTGCLFGLTLDTKPEDIYLCLIEATAFGMKRIIQGHEEHGITINRIIACGGIPMKSTYIMQIYADILGHDILVSTLSNAAAVGAAVYAAAAAEKKTGGFDSLTDSVAVMSSKDFIVYQPQSRRKDYYREKYAKYYKLYELFGNKFSSLIK